MSNQTLSLAIQPFGSFARDTFSNKYWIIGALFSILIWTTISTSLFYYMEYADSDSQNKWFDSFYFTVINITTVGFGDITPKTILGKAISLANALFGLISFGAFIAILNSALQPSGFIGTGEFTGVSSSPHNNEDNSFGKNSEELPNRQEVPDSLGKALDLLASLGAIVDNKQEYNRTHARIILSPDQGDADIVVDFYVEVRRLGRSGSARPEGHKY